MCVCVCVCERERERERESERESERSGGDAFKEFSMSRRNFERLFPEAIQLSPNCPFLAQN